MALLMRISLQTNNYGVDTTVDIVAIARMDLVQHLTNQEHLTEKLEQGGISNPMDTTEILKS